MEIESGHVTRGEMWSYYMQQNEITEDKFGPGLALFLDSLWPLQLNVFNLWGEKKEKTTKKKSNWKVVGS